MSADAIPEIYVSTDVEADGPIPGPHSMLSFASAAYTADKQLIATFSANLETLEGATAHPVQEAWWKTQPDAWAACRTDLQAPAQALPAYVQWVEALPGKPVFVAYPAGFDFTYMFWYMMRFAERCPFSWSALDIKTLAFALTGLPYRTRMTRSTMRLSRVRCSATCWRSCAGARRVLRSSRRGCRGLRKWIRASRLAHDAASAPHPTSNPLRKRR